MEKEMKTYKIEYAYLVKEYRICEIEAESFEEALSIYEEGDFQFDEILESNIKDSELFIENSVFRNKDILTEEDKIFIEEEYKL